MSLPRTVALTLRCTSCSTPIARALSRATSNSPALRAPLSPSSSFQRPITSTARRSADKNDPATADPEYTFLDDLDTPKPPTTPTTAQSTSEHLSAQTHEPPIETAPSDPPPPATEQQQPPSTLPWYLQNRPAPTPTQTAILPPLPPNPPPLLEPILDYLANTAGLDALLLYDLRTLNPPPALGSSLLMLLCTARSEKHLHVSADRFCRWLRREHHLRATAAGLLGRNELKIKLRRKAKRMKMLANVGAAEPQGNLDDGIRTGWICCTVGKIAAHPDDKGPLAVRGQGAGFVGFSDVKPGVNLVVQMFTEEKRAEIDLETLWGGVLRTQARNEGRADELIKALEEEAEAGTEEVEEEIEGEDEEKKVEKMEAKPALTFNKTRPTVGDVFPPASSFDNRQQLRRLHTVGLRV